MTNDHKGPDLFGLKPIAESIKIVTQGTVDGAAAFLGKICLPAADEFGLLLKDKVHYWRSQNIINISMKAEALLSQQGGIEGKQIHPRLMSAILEHGSWVANDEIQQMWAGLLASSCTSVGHDESNLLFVNLLGQISTAEARLLNNICKVAPKKISLNGLLFSEKIQFTLEQLSDIWQDQDIHRIDRELDHLRKLGLIEGGFSFRTEETIKEEIRSERMGIEIEKRMQNLEGNKLVQNDHSSEEITVKVPPLLVSIGPSAIGLHLYVRGQGHRSSPVEYFKLPLCKNK